MVTVTRTPVYTAADGSQFPTHKEAVQHGKFLQRLDNVKALNLDLSKYVSNDDGGISPEDLPEILALFADKLLTALDVRETRNKKSAAA